MTATLSVQGVQGAKYDPAAIVAAAVACGLVEASPRQLEEAWEIAGRLISSDITPLPVYARVAAHSGVCVFVYVEEGHVTGMYAMLLLSKKGLQAMIAQSFDARTPDLDHLARPDEAAYAHYGWGVVATTRASARATFAAMDAINIVSFEDLPYYVRAATDDGRRVILRTGCMPVPWGDPNLFWSGGPVRELRGRT